MSNYQNRALNIGFEREIKTLTGAVQNLAVSENKVNFYSTVMYTITEPVTYDNTSGKFVKKYMKVSKYCGNSNGDCFADKYYNYNESTHKKEVYVPAFKGACASLKNGASICITPQVGSQKISGLIDINGKKGPNVFGRDLRHFIIDSSAERSRFSRETTEVLFTPESDLEPKQPEDVTPPMVDPGDPLDPCEESSISKACCDTKSITNKTDPCCIHYKGIVGHACYEKPAEPDCKNVKQKLTYSCNFNPSTYIFKCTVSQTFEPEACVSNGTWWIWFQHGTIGVFDIAGKDDGYAPVFSRQNSRYGNEPSTETMEFNLQSAAAKEGVTLSNCDSYAICKATYKHRSGYTVNHIVSFRKVDISYSLFSKSGKTQQCHYRKEAPGYDANGDYTKTLDRSDFGSTLTCEIVE